MAIYNGCMLQINDGISLYRALSELARKYQLRNRDEVCCYGLTVSQCYALQALSEKGVMASSALAMGLGLEISTTTRLVDQLVRKKLATRRRDAKDARVREVEITEAGRRLISRIEVDFGRILANSLADLPATAWETLPVVIRRLANVLNCGDASCTGAIKQVNEKKRAVKV